MQRRVVITGMGAITPLGLSVGKLFSSAVSGRSGVGPITRFDASTFPTRFAAEVKGFDLAEHVENPQRWAHSCEASQFVAAASVQAMRQAGLLEAGRDRSRFGVYLGAGEATQEVSLLLAIIGKSYREETNTLDSLSMTPLGLAGFHPQKQHEQELHTIPGHLADYFHLEGPNCCCLTACAAGTQAIGEAAQIIRRGEADLILAGGAHSMIYPLGVTGFSLLTALSRRNEAPQQASRPFDRMRDGFVLGEGAGVVILEEWEHAQQRGAVILAELTGYGVTADAFRVTDSHPQGRGAATCMEAALKDANLTPDQIGYINAHGTSTRVNDLSETIAIKQVFGESAAKVPISSSKSMMGHLIGAAGAVELILCVEAIRQEMLPPTINYEIPDPECDLDYIPNVARHIRVDHVLSNSFGFGGQNASLIVSRYRP